MQKRESQRRSAIDIDCGSICASIVAPSHPAGGFLYSLFCILYLIGWFGDVEHACICSPALVRRYQRRVPEALRERIDIHVEVPRVAYVSEAGAQRLRLTSGRLGEPSAVVAERVARARRIQTTRFATTVRCSTNAELNLDQIRVHCELDGAGHSLMKAKRIENSE